MFALTRDYPWPETCTELAMFAQRPVLEAHVLAARAHNFHLMRRISAKLRVGSPIKYHFFHPATLDDALGPRRQRRRNLELTRVDPDSGMICQEFTPRNHIKLHLHESSEGKIVCTGDKQPIRYPPEYFRGVARELGGKRLFVMDPRYLLLKERETTRAGITRHPERHQESIRRLEIWLTNHAEQYPLMTRQPYRRPVSDPRAGLRTWPDPRATLAPAPTVP